MPHHHDVKTSGTITDVFGHRFVVKTRTGTVLADIGPDAAARITLGANQPVKLEGEQKPTEIKVHRISVGGSAYVEAHHEPRDRKEHGEQENDFTAADAKRIAEKEGFRIVGALTPHKKHYEATAEHGGSRHDIHVHKDHIMKKHKVR